MFFFFKQKTAYEIRPRDWSSDVCSSDLAVLAQAQVDQLDASRDLQLREVDRVVELHRRQIDLDELRQVLRQALDLDLVDVVLDHAAADLDARGDFAALEVDRHLHADRDVGGGVVEHHIN